MAMSQLFAPFAGSTVNLTASTTSSRVAKASLPSSSSPAPHEMRVVNTGTVVVYIEFGDSTVAASSATSMPILPNTVESFMVNASQTHIAAVSSSGTPTLFFTTGLGV